MNTRLQITMLMPGGWMIASFGWLYLSTRLGYQIHSNTAAAIVLTWLIAAPLALVAGTCGVIYCVRNWNAARLSKLYTAAHILFIMVAITVIIGMLKLPDFRGQ
ncbi:MAG: hypothetical protein ACOX3F_01915 [Kiritimatiellia bacterium]